MEVKKTSTLHWTPAGPTLSRLLIKIQRANLTFEKLSKRQRGSVECFPVRIFDALIALLLLVRCINSKSLILKLSWVVSRAKDRYTQSAMVMIPCSKCADPGESSRTFVHFNIGT
jgi:hypothetical protein